MKLRLTFWLIIFLFLLSVLINLPQIPTNLSISIPQVKLPLFATGQFAINFNNFLGRFPLKLGLDLQGGTQLVLQTDMSKIDPGDQDEALESSKEIIEKRVNLFGVSEAVVQTSKLGKTRRILVDLPGVKDASEAASLVGKTAQLEVREITSEVEQEASSAGIPAQFFAKPTGLTGKDLKKFSVTFGASGTDAGPQVALDFTPEGAQKFAEITKRNTGKPLPIFLDEQLILSPVVQQEILGGKAVITGNFTPEEAKQITVQLNAGALPVPIKIIEQRSVGASLGQDSINKSLLAGVIGLGTIIVYMGLYYGWLGLIADLALIVYAIFVLAIFKTGLFIFPPITLTLAGIAGFILSIGMAVDANILIFERMKEEKRWGKENVLALEQGFQRAWVSIRDSNTSSLITASILYFIGSGAVKGFAITLAIGVMVSMFTAIVVTRTILRLLIKR